MTTPERDEFACWTVGGFGDSRAQRAMTTNAHSGPHAALMTVTHYTSGAQRFIIDRGDPDCTIAVKPGEMYTLSVWLKTHTTSLLTAYLQDANGRWHWWAETPAAPANSAWHKETLETLPVPSWAQALVYGVSALDVGRVFVDDPVVARRQGPAPTPGTPEVGGPAVQVVNVRTSDELVAAVNSARPGVVINLADGTYTGTFTMRRSGTRGQPITIQGSRQAILQSPSVSSAYTVHLDDVSHIRLVGFSVRGGQKGIVLDESDHNTLTDLDVSRSGSELVLFRNNSSFNKIHDSVIHGSGKTSTAYGEGVYIGQSRRNWPTGSSRTRGRPDRSDHNAIEDNHIFDTTAECVDIKEGTSSGLVRGNVFSGGSITGENYADSWVDIAGNGYSVVGNTGTRDGGTLKHGYQTQRQHPGWGNNNTFDDNHGTVDADGHGIHIHELTSGNTVYRSNSFTDAAQGTSNIPLT